MKSIVAELDGNGNTDVGSLQIQAVTLIPEILRNLEEV